MTNIPPLHTPAPVPAFGAARKSPAQQAIDAHNGPNGDGFWTTDGLRAKVKGMVEGQYGIAMGRIMSHPDFSTLIDLETAALTRYDGLMYIESVQKICSEYTRRGLPEPTPYVAPATRRMATENVFALCALSKKAQRYIEQAGLGSERYEITGQCEKNSAGNEAAYFVELAFAIRERASKGWREAAITAVIVDNRGWSWRQGDNSEFKHTGRVNDPASTMLLDLVSGLREVQPGQSMAVKVKAFYKNQSDGTRNKLVPVIHRVELIEEPMTAKPAEDKPEKTDADLLNALKESGAALTDELTGEPLDAKPADPKPQPLKPTDVQPERPPFPTEVADLISAAFPLASSEYKAEIFKSAIGWTTIAKAKESGMSEWGILDALRNEIATVKNLAANLPSENDERPAALTGVAETVQDVTGAKSEPQSALVLNEAQKVETAVIPFAGYAAPQIPRSLQIMSTPAGARLIDLAKSVAASKMYPGVDTLDKAIVIMWKGVELGIEPFAALEGIHIIGGKPSLSSNLLLSLANSSGLIRDVRIVGDGNQCEVTMWRKDRPDSHTEIWTYADAERAGLPQKNPTWGKYPKAMCKARAISNCFKAVCPELAMGIRGMADDDEQDEDKMLAQELVAA